MPNGGIQHIDDTVVQGFEKVTQNVIPIQPWQCPECLRRFGEKGRKAGQVTIITIEGQDRWCQECFEKGLKEGICVKAKKLSKKERKRLKKERWQK